MVAPVEIINHRKQMLCHIFWAFPWLLANAPEPSISIQKRYLSESEEFFLLEMFFSSNTIGNAFQYHFFFCPASRSCKHIVLWGEDSLGSCAIYFCIRIWSNSDEFCWRERSYEYTTDMWVAPSIMATIWGGSLRIWSCAIYFQWQVWPNCLRPRRKSSSDSPLSSVD